MVSPGRSADPRLAGDAPPAPSVGARLLSSPSRFLALLPAWIGAVLCLRLAELVSGWPPGLPWDEGAWIVVRALADDALTVLRHGPILFVLALPDLLARAPRRTLFAVAGTWSLLFVLQACLVAYFVTARVPLGADLYAYSPRELAVTVGAAPHLPLPVLVGTLAGLALLILELRRRLRRDAPGPNGRVTVFLAVLSVILLVWGPVSLPASHGESEYARTLRESKAAFFVDASLAALRSAPAGAGAPSLETDAAAPDAMSPPQPGAASRAPGPARDARDPRYPFLHAETTPDSLGPLFALDAHRPPNLVIVIVEGLGRSFSGPGAELGSFTPFLDELAAGGLYFENFLSTQGRTFAVLPSLLGSLPFADQGFAALGTQMPEHASLLSVLRGAGYETRFFTGTDSKFDDERTFLERQGVERIVDRDGFAPGTARVNEWGFDDGELVSRVLAEPPGTAARPLIDVIQTITMHDPYRFRSQAEYEQRVEARLDALGIGESQKTRYRAQRAIYASILYTDDALRRYFDEARRRPDHANTIYLVTGDHRLPEIPISEWIDRYHVPLIISSPLLRHPARIKSVSSHFDVTPSLLAMLSHAYAFKTPRNVTWLGTGLDVEPGFRSLHEFPLKQTKGNLVDFVSGEWLLSRGALYRFGDGLHAEATDDTATRDRLAARFAAFQGTNASLGHGGRLVPPGTAGVAASFASRAAQGAPAAAAATPAASASLAVRDVTVPDHAAVGALALDLHIGNGALDPSVLFVPLVVLLTVDGQEASETYGKALTLPAHGSTSVHLAVKTDGVAPGRYFLSVYPSDPATGKRVGEGRFRIPVVLDAATPGT
jgi:hypothetical protein